MFDFNIKSLSFKISAASIILIGIFGLAAVFSVYTFTKNEILETEGNYHRLLLSATADKIASAFSEARFITEIIARGKRTADYLSAKNPAPQDAAMLEYFESLNIGSRYSAIYLLNNQGIAMVSTDKTFVGNNYSFRAYFKEAIAGNSWSEMSIGVTSKLPGYYFSYPIRNSGGKPIAVIVAKLNTDVISKILDLKTIDAELSVMMSDNDGLVVFSTKEGRLFRSLGNLDAENLERIAMEKSLDKNALTALGYDPIQKILPEITDVKELSFYDAADSEDEIIFVARVPNEKYHLIFEHGLSEFTGPAKRSAAILGVLVAICAALAGAGIYFTDRIFLKPIRKFTAAVKEIGTGNFSSKVDIESGDEFGELARGFNAMADKIKDYKDDLENKIRERTAELEKANDELKRMNSFMIDRELKMAELKKEIEQLKNPNIK